MSTYRWMLCDPTRHRHGCELCTDGARFASDNAARTVSISGKWAFISGYLLSGIRLIHYLSAVNFQIEEQVPTCRDLSSREEQRAICSAQNFASAWAGQLLDQRVMIGGDDQQLVDAAALV